MRVSTVQCYPPIILRKKQGIELTSSTEQRDTEGIKAAFRDSGPAALKTKYKMWLFAVGIEHTPTTRKQEVDSIDYDSIIWNDINECE